MDEHTSDKCSQYDEEIIDEVCQDPRIHSLVCVNCRFNKGLSIKPKTKTAELALGP